MSVGAAVQPLPYRRVELTVGEIDELRESLHKVELALASLSGEVRSLRELKAQDNEHIGRRLEDEAGKRHKAEKVIDALHTRLDRYPPPDDIHTTVKDFAAFKNRIAGAILAGMALGVGGGTALGQWIAGG